MANKFDGIIVGDILTQEQIIKQNKDIYNNSLIWNSATGQIMSLFFILTGISELYEQKANKGVAGGYAGLDETGTIPEHELPSYVDDVKSYDNLAGFPITGLDGLIYVAKDTNRTYRWSGTSYIQMDSGLALGETSATAFPGDKGKISYDHSQATGNPHNTTKSDVGLSLVPNLDTTNAVNNEHTHSNKAILDTITNFAYGEIFREANTTAQSIATGVNAKITALNEIGDFLNTAIANNEIEVAIAGMYKIDCSLTAIVQSGTQEYSFYIAKNGIIQSKTKQTTKWDSNNNKRTININGLLNLIPTDKISLYVGHTDGGTKTITVNSANINLIKIK